MTGIEKRLEPRQRFAPGKRRLTAEQFDAVRPHLKRLSAERIRAARMALVDDIPMQAIADYFGWSSRQTVSDAVTSIFAALARYEEARLVADGTTGILAPPGWEAVTLLAPPELITRWRKELAHAFGKILAMEHNTQVQAQKPRKRQSTLAAAAVVMGETLPIAETAKKSPQRELSRRGRAAAPLGKTSKRLR